jgi:hypothetical protein
VIRICLVAAILLTSTAVRVESGVIEYTFEATLATAQSSSGDPDSLSGADYLATFLIDRVPTSTGGDADFSASIFGTYIFSASITGRPGGQPDIMVSDVVGLDSAVAINNISFFGSNDTFRLPDDAFGPFTFLSYPIVDFGIPDYFPGSDIPPLPVFSPIEVGLIPVAATELFTADGEYIFVNPSLGSRVVDDTVVPEPTSLAIFGIGALGVVVGPRRRRTV